MAPNRIPPNNILPIPLPPTLLTPHGIEVIRNRVDEYHRALEHPRDHGPGVPDPVPPALDERLEIWTRVRMALIGLGDQVELRSIMWFPSGRVIAQITGEEFEGQFEFPDQPEAFAVSWSRIGFPYAEVRRPRGGTVWTRNRLQHYWGEPLWHPPLAGDQRAMIKTIRARFGGVYPVSPARWEEWFRRTLFVKAELGLWLGRAEAFEHFTGATHLSLAERTAYLKAIVAISDPRSDPGTGALTMGGCPLTPAQIGSIIGYYEKRRFPRRSARKRRAE